MSAGTPRTELSVSVLLATYNRRALLPAVLAPVLADPATSEVVVVVDGATDGSLELLEEMARDDPRIKPIAVANGGAARALATGGRQATGELLVILDDDEIIDEGTISGHRRHHDGSGGLLVVGYVEMELPPTRRPGDFSRYIYARQYEQDCATWEAKPETILRNLWAGYVSLSREDYLAVTADVGEFVDGYHYDLDFGARCVERGLNAVFDRSLRARHLYQRDRAGYLRDARSSGRNRILIHRTHDQVLGPIAPDFVDAGLPPLGATALRLTFGRPLLERLLALATTASGRLHLWRLETLGASLMWAIEQKRGALQAARELADG